MKLLLTVENSEAQVTHLCEAFKYITISSINGATAVHITHEKAYRNVCKSGVVSGQSRYTIPSQPETALYRNNYKGGQFHMIWIESVNGGSKGKWRLVKQGRQYEVKT